MPTDFSLPEAHVHPSASVLLLILCPLSDYPSYPTSMFYPSFQSDLFADLGSRRDTVQYILLLLAPTCVMRMMSRPPSLTVTPSRIHTFNTLVSPEQRRHTTMRFLHASCHAISQSFHL